MDEMGEMNVNEAMACEDQLGKLEVDALEWRLTNVAAHFRFLAQFFGLSGSCGPSQVTRNGSRVDSEG